MMTFDHCNFDSLEENYDEEEEGLDDNDDDSDDEHDANDDDDDLAGLFSNPSSPALHR